MWTDSLQAKASSEIMPSLPTLDLNNPWVLFSVIVVCLLACFGCFHLCNTQAVVWLLLPTHQLAGSATQQLEE